MPSETTTFQQISEDIAARFLHSVVVVDDQAFLQEDLRERLIERNKQSAKLQKPSRLNLAKASDENEISLTPIGDEHDLNAKVLIDLFAEKGLVCSVLVPEKNENPLAKTVSAAKRSDIVMLDWRIHDDNGETTIKLIEEILKDDEKEESRLRMIAIYTAEPDLNFIVEKIKEELQNHHTEYKLGGDDSFTLTKGPVRIVIFAKEKSILPPGDNKLRSRFVPLNELPQRLISEFSLATMGLISNVALESLGAVRSNTHRILRKFHPGLDAAYLTHRALIDPPEEAELHLVPLVASEIQAVLEDRHVYKHVNVEIIGKWIELHVNKGLKLYRRLKMKTKAKAKGAMLDIIEKGVGDKDLAGRYPQRKKLLDKLRLETDKRALNEFTNLLTLDGTSGVKCDEELALLMSIRSRYESPPPMLMLGTIIADEADDGTTTFWLCVQPVCDSVRLDRKRDFPFLRMSKSQTDGNFNFLVNDKNSLIKLNLSLRPHQSKLITFKPKRDEKEIRATKSTDAWHFESVGTNSKKYRWVADLKTEHAQRVANDYSRQISRVGLLESEWLRRWSKK
jgi:hypothetical protein